MLSCCFGVLLLIFLLLLCFRCIDCYVSFAFGPTYESISDIVLEKCTKDISPDNSLLTCVIQSDLSVYINKFIKKNRLKHLANMTSYIIRKFDVRIN
jgi:thioredoxin-related protein